MSGSRATIDDLPNEILLQILALLPTTNLLPLAVLSSRFHAVVLNLFERRLAFAASLQGRELLVELSQPIWRGEEPALCCKCLGTPGLDDREARDRVESDTVKQTARRPGRRFRELRNAYTHFRPHKRTECISPAGSRARPRHPAGDIPGIRTHPDTIAAERAALYGNSQEAEVHASGRVGDSGYSDHVRPNDPDANPANDISAQGLASALPSSQIEGHEAGVELKHSKGEDQDYKAASKPAEKSPPVVPSKHAIVLYPHQSFKQLITVATLISRCPQSGIARSVMTASQGVLRLWKDWLSEASRKVGATSDAMDHERVLWVNDGPENVGVKLRVHQRVSTESSRRAGRGPSDEPEEPPVSYDIEYEEVLMRTTSLLLLTEKIWEEQGLEEVSISVLGAGWDEILTGRWR